MDPITVVVADDEPALREALAELIGATPGFALAGTAPDAAGAVEQCRLHRPDVAVLDVDMPGGGRMAALGIRAASPGTRLVVLSGADDPATREEMAHAGAQAYVVKSAAGSQLLDTLRAVVGEPCR